MTTTAKFLLQDFRAGCAVLLLFLMGWFASCAMGSCLSHAAGDSARGPQLDSRGVSVLGCNFEHGCCVLRGGAQRQPSLAPGPSLAEPEPWTRLAPATVHPAELPNGALPDRSDGDVAFPHRPLYLIFNRLLIPAFLSA